MRVPKALTSIPRNVALFTKHNAPTIMTCVGAIGVVVTAVSAVKTTTKISQMFEEATDIKGGALTIEEKIRIAWPSCVPTALIGAATITCIFGANVLNKRHQASLISAYTMLDQSYKQYKSKVTELYGEDANVNVTDSIAKDNYPRQGE